MDKQLLEDLKSGSTYLKGVGQGHRAKCPMTGDSIVRVRPEKTDEIASNIDKAVEHFESRETTEKQQTFMGDCHPADFFED